MSDKPMMRDTLLPKAIQRPRGRPPVDDPLTALTTWVPTDIAQRLDHLATKHDVSVSSLVRQLLILRLR